MMYDEKKFDLRAAFEPKGDQPKAIAQLLDGFKRGMDKQVLLGVTGSGKTFTISHVINNLNKPTLVLAHNKTLAAQLYHEFKDLFPKNRVEYFVSYYDYYQPESYIPSKDMYVPKDAQVNPKIEQMRVSATEALLTRRDVIVVSSVSCIYSLGDPSMYKKLSFELRSGMKVSRKQLIVVLLEQQYERNDLEPAPGNFRVRGDVIDVIPSYRDDMLRIELFGDEIERMSIIDRYNMEEKEAVDVFRLFPAKHFAIDEDSKERAIESINRELKEVLPTIDDPIIAHRLRTRVKYDVEMIQELGYCKGIENYSIHFDGRSKGKPPYCLLDYFPADLLMVIDESHQTLPQLHGMYNGDISRKKALVEYGFRLPSAFDNRPLRFDEFKRYLNNVVFVSATPSEYEKGASGQIVEQIIRPTGLVDPLILKRPIKGQADDLIREINTAVSKNYRALVTTLTKRMAEELTEYLSERGVKARYLHSEIDTLERSELIRQLRLGNFDVLVGINLLREGLDIPEVALVAILDADKEGFLRNDTSLIQIVGRAARNSDSRVILYMDNETDSIRRATGETNRRREIQMAYNREHGISPQTIIKPIREQEIVLKEIKSIPKAEIPEVIEELELQMRDAADQLDFEMAILYRDKIEKLKKKMGNATKS
ncbi:MAG TPA: excinuclease ABC subunit UvrB [Candidatus Methanofastidiosa archaeon]|nr:excinuclease ABC subunit UvrB [Candidatus Methanofastidiosa archaeon]